MPLAMDHEVGVKIRIGTYKMFFLDKEFQLFKWQVNSSITRDLVTARGALTSFLEVQVDTARADRDIHAMLQRYLETFLSTA